MFTSSHLACQDVKLTSNSNFNNSYENCEHITGGLAISGLKLQVPNLSKIRKITGKLVVQSTNFKDLSFLENLEEIELGSEANGAQDISIDIRDNFKMKRLGLKSLKVRLISYSPTFPVFRNSQLLTLSSSMWIFSCYMTISVWQLKRSCSYWITTQISSTLKRVSVRM